MRLVLLFILAISFLNASYAKTEAVVVYQIVNVDDGGKTLEKKGSKIRKLFSFNKSESDKQLKGPLRLLQTKKRTKAGAILMAVLTGPLGGHRLYLGTEPHVPIVYTLTLGGGMGLLPVIDIVCILVTKDLSKFEDCSQIIMWGN